MTHGAGHLFGVLVAGGARDVDVHDLGGAFAVLDEHVGQFAEHFGERLFQDGKFAFPDRDAGSAVGKAVERVVGGGVAVDAHAVERGIGRAAEHGAPGGGLHGGVAHDEGEHGGHVGAYHARALGHARKTDGSAFKGKFPAGHLGIGVRGHHGAGKAFDVHLAEGGHERGNGGFPLVHGHLCSDDAGGGGQKIV